MFSKASYAPTVIARVAVDGMVSVVSGVGSVLNTNQDEALNYFMLKLSGCLKSILCINAWIFNGN